MMLADRVEETRAIQIKTIWTGRFEMTVRNIDSLSFQSQERMDANLKIGSLLIIVRFLTLIKVRKPLFRAAVREFVGFSYQQCDGAPEWRDPGAKDG
jgi:hypothetical protein